MTASMLSYFGDPAALTRKFVGNGVTFPEPSSVDYLKEKKRAQVSEWRRRNVEKGLTTHGKVRIYTPRNGKSREIRYGKRKSEMTAEQWAYKLQKSREQYHKRRARNLAAGLRCHGTIRKRVFRREMAA